MAHNPSKNFTATRPRPGPTQDPKPAIPVVKTNAPSITLFKASAPIEP